MSAADSGPKAEVLSVEDCWKYLDASYIGRLAVISGGSPEIFPVNFVPVKKTLVFRTAPGTKLRSLLTGAPVCFETDGLNAYGTEVWSVVVKGTPAPVSGNELESELKAATPDREPWGPGLKDHMIQLRPTEVTGRRFAVHSRTRWWPPLDFSSEWT
ncbi:pyridoxamine 5'-phosphate oxidase family protein [Pseudarthrobacter siccitolerans]|uniref:pyridoxamine 5'-phosphate oxidase family protein n=1 Tax=Pseudarthrobacter siccitolerans TaxID=861266 RepID=UPI0006795E75|nr:pyridoxamine 5'-phosphate oxidase family protein [Pseudarthrobacter siccitolerans]